ncbi:MAG TPA: formate dehydrogenase accessory sulfurtransferase FdhD [Candidatus Binatia bacterium]|nr:formate dehydrogenase accessory sulfurtransferase FdhD [Candidatus Binatia bacterium]
MTISAKLKKNGPEAARETGLVSLPEEVLLRITVDGRGLSRLSCSPFGQDELVLGWLFGQDLIVVAADVEAMEIAGDQARVQLHAAARHRLERYHPLQVTACSGGDVRPGLFENLPLSARDYRFTLAQAIRLMEQLPSRAEMFKRHGGIHCSMLADMKRQRILASREDIGRSNSVDKVIGWGLGAGVDFSCCALLTTGRISAEMALKVLHAGIPTLISQTTLTSKALEIVRRTGLTLIGHVLKPRPILLNF